jgi:hypothetical protein
LFAGLICHPSTAESSYVRRATILTIDVVEADRDEERMSRLLTPTDLRTTFVLVAVALAFAGMSIAGSGNAEVDSGCPHRDTGVHTRCTTAYRVTRHRFRVTVPHSGARQEGLSPVRTVRCRRHERVLGGGAEAGDPRLSVALSAPDRAATGWSAQLVNLSTVADVTSWLDIHAICAPLSQGPREGSPRRR